MKEDLHPDVANDILHIVMGEDLGKNLPRVQHCIAYQICKHPRIVSHNETYPARAILLQLQE